MPAISIIIPIYKVESFLRECLDSVSCQSFGDFEVLCVDDGSPDGSADIVREKMLSDARFTLIEKENGGVSSARNCGLDHARGEIVMFVDGDDALERNACERISEVFHETSADVVMFGARVEPAQRTTPWFERVLSPEAAQFESLDVQELLSDRFSPFIWDLAVRRDVLEGKGIRFDEDVPFGEDVVFQMAMFPRVGKVVRIEDKLYRYRLDRAGSFMDSYAGDARRLSAHLDMMAKVFADWRTLGLLGEHARRLKAWSEPYLLEGVDRLPKGERVEHVRRVGALWQETLGGIGTDPAKASIDCLCRGDGKLYVKCDVDARLPFADLECAACARGVPVPSFAYPLVPGQSGVTQSWVLELPLLDVSSVNVSLRPDGYAFQQVEMKISYTKAKWLSRINYRLKPSQCAAIRDYERSFTSRHYQVEVLERFEAGEKAVWRLKTRWSGSAESLPVFDVFDGKGRPVEADWSLFEFQPAGKSSVSSDNILFLSLTTSGKLFHLTVVARNPSSDFESGFATVDQEGFEALKRNTENLMLAAGDDSVAYQSWLNAHRAKPGKLAEQRALPVDADPFFTVVVLPREGSSDKVHVTLDSLMAQTYAAWEAVVFGPVDEHAARYRVDGRFRFVSDLDARDTNEWIRGVEGSYVAFATSGDVLEPDALFEYRREIERACETGKAPVVLYCDEDVLGEGGLYERPLLKSKLNVDALYCRNWVGNFLVVERGLLASMDVCDGKARSAWGYDRALRAYEMCPDGFAHVPRVLYHALESPLDSCPVEGVRNALEAHLGRRGLNAFVVDGPVLGSARIRYEIEVPHPLVSVVIPSKDRIDLLEPCVRSIVEKSTYDALEILVIENNSTEPETFDFYERIQREYPIVRVLHWPDEFNYAKLMNFGAEHAKGEYLLMLNNDTEVIEPSFIEEMLGCLQRPEVGVVGGKLLFRDGLVQHAGIGVGVWNAVVHVNQNKFGDDGGYLDRACLPGNFSAVTGACQMVRLDVYHEVGGYDERFAVGFNDIDFCMRILQSGRLVTFTPYALLHHYEFSSRGREIADSAKLLRWKREQALFVELWPEPFVMGDPYTGPNLMRDNTYYRLGD